MKTIYDSEHPEVAETPKRDAVKRITEALHDKNYRCVQTGLANYAQNGFGSDATKKATGWDFSVWLKANSGFILFANETMQEYQLAKIIETKTVDEDIALL